MNTRVFRITEEDVDIIKMAAEVIKSGGLVAFPTETVYGLGANALNGDACDKIYEAKDRPKDNPLIVHVADFDISSYVKSIPHGAKKLMETFWPGPLTIIMEKSDLIPLNATAGLNSVAVRMPENKIARRLIEYSGIPIAAPSANRSGRPSPTTIEHCIEDLAGRVDMIIGGDKSEIGLESTVVDATGDDIVILRPGAVTREMMEDVVGEVEMDSGVMHRLEADAKPKSPGMKYRHYAPRAPLVIVRGEVNDMVEYINKMTGKYREEDIKVGIMATDETKDMYEGDSVLSVGSRKNPGIIAANLFDCLREFDKIDVGHIFAEGFSEEGLGLAIMNRLKKAAGYRIVDAGNL